MSVEQPRQPAADPVRPDQDPWAAGAGTPAAQDTAPVQGYVPPPAVGPVGKVRGTGVCILLAVVTLGIYTLVWYFQTHDEMKRHTGQGIGGVVALLLALFIGIASPFLSSSEVGGLYERRGQAKPVSGATALWYFPGIFILVGPLVWFVKTNGALNSYWRSLGAS